MNKKALIDFCVLQSEVLKATLATDAVIGAMVRVGLNKIFFLAYLRLTTGYLFYRLVCTLQVLDMFSYTMSWGRLAVNEVFGRMILTLTL